MDLESNTTERRGDWMPTFSGGRFWVLDPRADEIHIEDLAHHLALECRFGKTCRTFYSVAQHCVLASYLVAPENAMWALLHDAAEAYLGDLPRPIKQLPEMAAYRAAEAAIMLKVCERFGLPAETPADVKVVDEVMLSTEARDIASSRADIRTWRLPEPPLAQTIRAWPWEVAEQRFLTRFVALGGVIEPRKEVVTIG